MWERDETLPDEIKKAWQSGGEMHNLDDIRKTLAGVMKSLGRWSHDKFGVVTRELEKVRGRMEELSVVCSPGSEAELMVLRRRMNELLYREEMMWLQRSRAT
jgi:hypothetical protein